MCDAFILFCFIARSLFYCLSNFKLNYQVVASLAYSVLREIREIQMGNFIIPEECLLDKKIPRDTVFHMFCWSSDMWDPSTGNGVFSLLGYGYLIGTYCSGTILEYTKKWKVGCLPYCLLLTETLWSCVNI